MGRGLSEPIVERQLSLLDDPGLPEQERRFADEYIRNGWNGAAAYRVAMPTASNKRAGVGAHQWLKRNRIRQYIRQRCGELADNAKLEQAEVIRIYREAAMKALGNIPVRKSFRTLEELPNPENPNGIPILRHRIDDALMFEPTLGAAVNAATGLARVLGIGGDELTISTVLAPLGELDDEERALLQKLVLRRASRAEAQMEDLSAADDSGDEAP